MKELSELLTDPTTGKMPENTIAFTDENLKSILKRNPIALAVLDQDLRYIFVSDKYLRDYDLEPMNVDGKRIAEVIPDIPNRWIEALQLAVNGESRSFQEDHFIKPNGSIAFIRWECSPWLDSNGKVRGVITFSENITDRKIMERALRESESRFRQVYENAPVMMHSISTDTLVFNVNSKWLQEMGYSRREVVGRKITDFMTAESSDKLNGVMKTFWSSGKISDLSYRYIRKDGSIIDVLLDSVVIDDPLWGKSSVSVVGNVTERKAAELAIRRSEAKYKFFLANAPIGILVVDTEGRILETNQALLDVLGSNSLEATKAINMFTLPNLVKFGISDLCKKCMTKGVVLSLEAPYVSFWGKWVYLRWILTPMRDIDGKVTGCQAVLEDITERKETEHNLNWELAVNSAIAELYDLLVSPASSLREIGEFLLDKSMELTQSSSGYIAEINSYTKTFKGNLIVRASDCMLDKNIKMKLFALREDGIYNGLWGHSLNTKESFFTNSAAEHESATGVPKSHFSIRSFISAPITIGEELIGQISLANSQRDYTSKDLSALDRLARNYALAIIKKKAERTQAMLATAVTQSADAIAITDPHGKVEYVNPAFEKVTGFASADIIRKNINLLKSGKQNAEFYANIWKTINCCEEWSGRLINKKKDGSLYYEDQKISPVRNAEGAIVNFVSTKRDVTKQIMLEKQLIQSQKMDALGTLVGGIAHDFNNILQAILGYADLLLSEKDQNSPEFGELEVIVRSAKSGADLVQRLLTFGQRSESKFQSIDLNMEIQQVAKLLSRSIPKMIEIEIQLEPSLTATSADPVQIERILMNLAVNAKAAMPDGGRLTIATKNVILDEKDCVDFPDAQPGPYALLTVSDTGQGMDKEILARIFDPFFTTKAMGANKGTGLGLSIVYGIVKQHHGLIYCESEVGEGSSFHIYLPSITIRSGEFKVMEELAPMRGSETILLVDDEEFIRELGARILSRNGYNVLTAINGKEALDIYSSEGQKISAVILDLAMPQMGGEECYRELLKINPNIKVLIATGYGKNGVHVDLKAGLNNYIAKPYEAKQILRAVKNLIHGSSD